MRNSRRAVLTDGAFYSRVAVDAAKIGTWKGRKMNLDNLMQRWMALQFESHPNRHAALCEVDMEICRIVGGRLIYDFEECMRRCLRNNPTTRAREARELFVSVYRYDRWGDRRGLSKIIKDYKEAHKRYLKSWGYIN